MCMRQRTSEHCLLVITTTVPLFVCVCQNESVFNQEDRKTEATENYRICFQRSDNHEIKQIHLVKQLIHLSNQRGGQRRRHLLPGGDLRQMWRRGDDPLSGVAARIGGRIDCCILLKSRVWHENGNATQFTKFYFLGSFGKLFERPVLANKVLPCFHTAGSYRGTAL